MKGTSPLVPALLLLASSCVLRPYDQDPVAVNARYEGKFNNPCNAWLRSAVTGYLYCSSPPFKVEASVAVVVAPPAPTATDLDTLMGHGKGVYGNVCAACHQADGKGTPGVFPPLAGSGAYYGDPQRHAAIVVKGVSGEIEVQGVKFNGIMPPQGHLSDYDIAAALTYERHSWGNADGIVLPSDVAAVR